MDQSDALRSAVAAAHRLVTTLAGGTVPGDGSADGAALAAMVAVLDPHLSPGALDKALVTTQAALKEDGGGADAVVTAILDWTDTLLGPVCDDAQAATELALTAPAEPLGAPDTVQARLLGRAAHRRGAEARRRGDDDEARAWWELAQELGHAGAGHALAELAAAARARAPARPADPDVDAQRLVAEVLAGAEVARRDGRLDAAAERYHQAAGLIRSLAAAEPHEPRHRRQLGSVQYTRGELLISGGRPDDAVAALDEAERAYGSLRPGRGPAGAAARWVADVQMRRARAHDQAGRGASALVDAEAGLVAYLDRYTGEAGDPLTLDVARMLAHYGHVVAGNGDPDLAVAAADTALRLYLSRADEINASGEAAGVHVPTFHSAALTSWAGHAAAGRDRLADAAHELARGTGPESLPLFGDVEEVRRRAGTARVTLAAALTRADAPALRATLVAPATDCVILCSTHRCPPAAAPAAALRIARLAERLIGIDHEVGLRLALEAHVLFAAASRARRPAGPDRFETLGPAWLRTLETCSHSCETAGKRALALDLARWMAGVAHHLGPRVRADPRVRAQLHRSLTWQAGLLHASGDRPAAQQAAAAARAAQDLVAG